MAFSSTKSLKAAQAFRISCGTFTNAAADVGGDIDTGIKNVMFAAAACSSHIGTEDPKVTWSGSTITLVCSEGSDGYWFAIGK